MGSTDAGRGREPGAQRHRAPAWQDVHTEPGASERETGVSPRKQRTPSLADPVYVNFGDKRGLSDVPGESSWGPEFRAGEGGTLGGGAISLLQPRRENPRPTYSL